VCAVVAVLTAAVLVQAHEIGTTRVSAIFQEGRYEIEVVTDGPSLVVKLETLADPGATLLPASDAGPAALRDRLASLDEVFRRRVRVAFDGAAVDPAITYAVSPAADATAPVLATIRLTGEIPRDARHFTWVYSWTFASYALVIRNRPLDNPTTEWLEGGRTSTPLALAALTPSAGRSRTAWRYLALGFTHIVPNGLDHMLFVIGIFLLSRRWRAVLGQVSAFTVAHSITLALGIYGLIAVPPAVVEPLIAVSIVYIAVENLLLAAPGPRRIALVFAFGLLHGMGFAGALQELGLPRAEFVTALVAFNAGVEAGQLSVIAAAFLLIGWACGQRAWFHRRVVVPVSVLIACTAVYWTIERVVS
jgi:hypothetical protein